MGIPLVMPVPWGSAQAIPKAGGIPAVDQANPQEVWADFQFDRSNSGHNAFETIIGPENVADLELSWEADLGDFTNLLSSPVLTGGRLYASLDAGHLYAIDPTSGTVLWVTTIPFSFGFTAPAAAARTVVVGSADGNVYALDAITGNRTWTFDTGAGVFSCPTILNGVVYVGSNDGNLYALSLSSGDPLWQRSLGSGGGPDSPAIEGGTVYVAARYRHAVFAFDVASGRKRWTRSLPTSYVGAGPAVDDGRLFITTRDGELVSLDANTGAILWHADGLGEDLRYPAVAEGVVYVGGENNRLSALDAATGAQLWTTDVDGELFSPIVANGVVYIGGAMNKLYAFDAITGALLWTAPAGGLVTNPIVVNGWLYFGSFDSHLYAYSLPDGSN